MVVWMSLKIGIFTEITSENLRYRTPQSDCFYNLTKIGYWHALRSKWDAPLSVPKKKKTADHTDAAAARPLVVLMA